MNALVRPLLRQLLAKPPHDVATLMETDSKNITAPKFSAIRPTGEIVLSWEKGANYAWRK